MFYFDSGTSKFYLNPDQRSYIFNAGLSRLKKLFPLLQKCKLHFIGEALSIEAPINCVDALDGMMTQLVGQCRVTLGIEIISLYCCNEWISDYPSEIEIAGESDMEGTALLTQETLNGTTTEIQNNTPEPQQERPTIQYKTLISLSKIAERLPLSQDEIARSMIASGLEVEALEGRLGATAEAVEQFVEAHFESEKRNFLDDVLENKNRNSLISSETGENTATRRTSTKRLKLPKDFSLPNSFLQKGEYGKSLDRAIASIAPRWTAEEVMAELVEPSAKGKAFLEEIAALLANDRRTKQAAYNGLIKAVAKRSSPNADDTQSEAASVESAAA
ncbi:MAG: hypothetical protein AB1861_03410 [Cyanobacteriota bacterium]